MKEIFRIVVVSLAAMGTFGCAHPVVDMREVPNVNSAPAPNEAVIIFMRPSGAAVKFKASVWEMVNGQPSRLVGIVFARRKVAYRVAPGAHLFSVVGRAADFMEAHLDAGRTYYVVVTPRKAFMETRFSLHPVHLADRAQLSEWQRGTTWTELEESSYQWAGENSLDVEAKQARYYPEWMEKAPLDRPVLLPEDGL